MQLKFPEKSALQSFHCTMLAKRISEHLQTRVNVGFGRLRYRSAVSTSPQNSEHTISQSGYTHKRHVQFLKILRRALNANPLFEMA